MPYFHSFDYLKVFFALAIVAWHTKAFGATSLVASQLNLNLKEILYANVLLVGVPIFVQLSLFLYLNNRQNKKNYFLKRITHLITIYVFWLAVVMILFYSGAGAQFKSLSFYLSGGATPLYFLLVIIVLTLLSEFLIFLKKILPSKIFLTSCGLFLLISVIGLFLKSNLVTHLDPKYWPLLMAHWNPLNFVPYVFSAFIFLDFYERGWFKRKDVRIETLWATGLIAFVIYFEYKLLPSQFNLEFSGLIVPPYTRLSIIFSTFLLTYVFLCRNYQPPKIIQTVSKYTLGIYLTHFVILYLIAGHLGGLYEMIKNGPIIFLLVLISSFTLTYLISERKII